MDKSGVFEGNKRKSYGDVGTTRGDVGGMKYSTGRTQSGVTSRLTSTARGAEGGAAKSAPSFGSGSRPRSDAVDRGAGSLRPKSGSERLQGMSIGLKGDIYTTKGGA